MSSRAHRDFPEINENLKRIRELKAAHAQIAASLKRSASEQGWTRPSELFDDKLSTNALARDFFEERMDNAGGRGTALSVHSLLQSGRLKSMPVEREFIAPRQPAHAATIVANDREGKRASHLSGDRAVLGPLGLHPSGPKSRSERARARADGGGRGGDSPGGRSVGTSDTSGSTLVPRLDPGELARVRRELLGSPQSSPRTPRTPRSTQPLPRSPVRGFRAMLGDGSASPLHGLLSRSPLQACRPNLAHNGSTRALQPTPSLHGSMRSLLPSPIPHTVVQEEAQGQSQRRRRLKRPQPLQLDHLDEVEQPWVATWGSSPRFGAASPHKRSVIYDLMIESPRLEESTAMSPKGRHSPMGKLSLEESLPISPIAARRVSPRPLALCLSLWLSDWDSVFLTVYSSRWVAWSRTIGCLIMSHLAL